MCGKEEKKESDSLGKGLIRSLLLLPSPSSWVSCHLHVEENVSQCQAGQKLVLNGETSWAAGNTEVLKGSEGIWVRHAEH